MARRAQMHAVLPMGTGPAARTSAAYSTATTRYVQILAEWRTATTRRAQIDAAFRTGMTLVVQTHVALRTETAGHVRIDAA